MRSTDAFHRVFPTSSWWKSKTAFVVVMSLLSVVLLASQLFSLFLIIDLFNRQGALELSIGEANTLTEYVHGPKPAEEDETWTPFETQLDDSGILPTVWHTRTHMWGPLILAVYKSTSLLQDNQNALLMLTFTLTGLGLIRGFVHSRIRLASVNQSLHSTNALKRSLHRQALRLETGALEGTPNSEPLNLFVTEVDNISRVLSLWIERISRNPLTITVLIAIAATINPRLALQCFVPLLACWYILKQEQSRSSKASKLAIAGIDRQSRLLAEGLNKPRLVRGYSMEDFEHEQFQKQMGRFELDVKRFNQRRIFSDWMARAIVLICVTVVIYLIGVKVLDDESQLSLAAALTMVLSFVAMLRPAEELYELSSLRKSAVISADEIYRYLNRIPDVGQAVGAKFLQPLSKSLEFEGVTYQLPGKSGPPILNRFDVRIPANSVTAIISTEPVTSKVVSYLLPRFIEPQQGRILFDGEDIAWVTLESLRAEAIYVGGQDPFFTGTVLDNITCGQDKYSLTDATDAAKLAHAHNFVQKLPQGYETLLGEHGEQLDIGQSFQLGLARAIVRDPALMVVEEPDSPLSDNTKKMLDDTYVRVFKKRTVIILPNRLSTLRRVDQIVFIHEGKVEAVGTHAELLKSQLYCHWEYVHFNEFRGTNS